jgi:hypothetical protein
VLVDPLAPLLELPGVRDAADSARVAVDRLLGHRVLRRQSAEVSAESSLRCAWASATLDGADFTLEKVRAGVDDPVVQGALRVSTEQGRLAETWQRAPAQVLARLHVLAAAGLASEPELGRPVSDATVSARLAGLVKLVAGCTAQPAVIVSAVVHAELRTLAPFRTGTGVVARAAARLTTVSRGLDPKALVATDVGHLELATEYDASLAAYAGGEPDGVARWLRHCCRATELGAREALAICEAVLRG